MSKGRPGSSHANSEVHLCDNRSHLLIAAADLAHRRPDNAAVLFSSDSSDPGDQVLRSFRAVTGVDVRLVSDRDSVEAFATLPKWCPAIIRRNLRWDRSLLPATPAHWDESTIGTETFGVGYLYHPGFFLSKVIAPRCDRVVMRDSGYANYVQHRVRGGKALIRLLAGRNPFRQTWGEESWIDEIQVARPDLIPRPVAHKATKLAFDDIMSELGRDAARSVAEAFWTGESPAPLHDGRVALLLTQPIDQLGMCRFDEKAHLYGEIANRIRDHGYELVVKHHPRDERRVLEQETTIPANFPIEAWSWLGQGRFDLAVSLNSTSLLNPDPTFAANTLQLIPPTSFYPAHWNEWPAFIDEAFPARQR